MGLPDWDCFGLHAATVWFLPLPLLEANPCGENYLFVQHFCYLVAMNFECNPQALEFLDMAWIEFVTVVNVSSEPIVIKFSIDVAHPLSSSLA